MVPVVQSSAVHRPAGAVSSALFGISLFVLLSGLLVNPWAGRLWRHDLANYREAMLEYAIWAAIGGAALALCGWRARKSPDGYAGRIGILLAAVLILVVLPDRLLLAKYGRRLLVHDKENIYRYRPNSFRVWSDDVGRGTISINGCGLRDDDFPAAKPAGEYRILCLGDSVTMGHGIAHEETFCELLESALAGHSGKGAACRVINAGVQGYATWQELNLLRRLLILQPDMVVIGFCLNDLTEPFVSSKALGGTGIGYQGFPATGSGAIGYFWSDTGYGRFFQNLLSGKQRVAAAKREETYNVANIARAERNDPVYGPAWDKTLADLRSIYALTAERGIRTLLAVFPYKFQILDRTCRRPQAILAEHAKEAGIEFVDLLTVFEESVGGAGNPDEKLRRYFLDDNHLSPEGHLLVATVLRDYFEPLKAGDIPVRN